MRRLPSKAEILREARRIELEDITLPSITPEREELRESGKLREARLKLMRSPATEGLMQQRKYVDTMAQELKLRVIPIGELRTLKRETGMEWTNGWTKRETRKVRAKKPIQPTPPRERVTTRVQIPRKPDPIKRILGTKKRKKRQKNHSRRTGVTPRHLRMRIRNGEKSFSFSDDVWKVRKPRRKRR